METVSPIEVKIASESLTAQFVTEDILVGCDSGDIGMVIALVCNAVTTPHPNITLACAQA